MADASDVNTAVDLALAAIDDADWSTAETQILKAELALAAMPEGQEGPTSLRYDRSAIRELRRNIGKRVSAAAGIIRTNVHRVRVGDTPG